MGKKQTNKKLCFRESSKQPNKRIINKAKDKSNKPDEEMNKTNGQLLSRSDSTSSSGTEFTKNKIIDSNLSTRSNHHNHLNENSDDESHEDDALTNGQLLDFKHNVKKLFDGLKEMGNKLLKDVDRAQQNFHLNKGKKFKSSDIVDIMSECKNIIQHVQDSTNKQEKKLIDRHKSWCKKSKVKNTFKNKNKNIDDLSDEEIFGNKRASTPIEKKKESRVGKSNLPLDVSDCDEQVFSGDDADNNNINHNDVDVDENSLDVSKDLFSDEDLPVNNVEQVSSKSSKKSSDESDGENDRRKKRFLKVKKITEKVDSDESTNDDDDYKEIQAKAQLLQSSSSDNSEKNKNDSDILLTPESQLKISNFYDAETDREENEKKQFNKSSNSDATEVDDPVPTKGSRKQLSDNYRSSNNVCNNNKTDVNNKKSVSLDINTEDKEANDDSEESEHEINEKKIEEEQAKKSLLKTSSDSDNDEDKEKKNDASNSSSDSEHENNGNIISNKKDEEAKKALLDSSSDSEHDDKINKSGLNSNSESDNEENLIKKKNKLSDSDNETISSKKRSSKIDKIHSNEDKKLKLKCIVELNRLGKKTLSQHSKALRLSAEYLENKKVSSLMSLDGLDKKKKKKKNRSDSSADESTHSKSRKKTKLTDDDTLLDHLKKVEIGNGNNDNDNSGSEDDSPSKKVVAEENELSLVQEADKLAKASILASSDSSDIETTPMETNDESVKNNDDDDDKKINKKRNKNNDKDDDEKAEEKKKDDSWKRSKLLNSKILDSDSDEENLKAQKKLSQRSQNDNDSDSNKEQGDDSFKKKKVTRTRRRRLDSDSDVKISDDSGSNSDNNKDENKDSDDDNKKKTIKRKKGGSDSSDSSLSLISKKSKTKRRRIRAVANDSDDSSDNNEDDDDDDDLNSSQGGANKSGRKNIRKVLKDKHVADGTLQAAKQEEERIKRMAERQKLYNEMYEARLASEAKVDKLVLDFDAETKQVLLEVDENLVKRLKPHQAKGIKFMWDACFESLERTKDSEGSGCILAHCMGLGKSFQVVTLSHTLLTHYEKTGINTILIVVPLSTVLNWMNEFKIWLSEVDNGGDIELYEMTKAKTNLERRCHLENWKRTGGVLIIGYEMFRNLCAIKGKVRKTVQEAILKCILDPGPDLIVCDEGHLLKNEDSAISKAIRRVKTLRRIVLTGTPLQNNLIEYHCMVQFVKPNLLGTKKEFSNRFVNPIQNGQFDDSTEYDVKLMKKRAHVLHKMLEGSVQRFDYSVLTPFLPPKQEYVISIRLSPVQVKLYQYYIDNFARKHKGVGGSLFADFQALSRLWTHPFVVKLHTENSERIQQKKRDAESDSEGSLKDFIDDGSDSASSTSESSNSSNSSNESDVIALDDDDRPGKKSKKDKAPPPKRGTRANPIAEPDIVEPEEATTIADNREWWTEFIKDEDFDDIRLSAKLMILFDIIKEAEAIGDKVLVFSQSLYSLTLIEKFLGMIDDETQNGNELDNLNKHTGCWAIGQDYFRFDGQTSAENRSHWVKSFNRPTNTRARLFLISTRAGGLGINLTAANRVVIFDASWNPSHDVQSIFRIYRFGQKKPCYVYRLLAAGTMEEKIYNRQVTKLSLSCRVVDELQIERHYSNNDLAELYKFDPPSETVPDLALPKDRLLAEIFLRHKNLVETFHEHDSLLENIAEEELDAEERKQAWQEYEDEKAGKRMIPPQVMFNYPNINQNHQHMLMMQQYSSQMVNSLNQLNNPTKQVELSQLMSMFQQDYPQLNEQQHRNMALKALSNMYNYVENQMIGRSTAGYNTGSILPNPVNNINNPTATLANALAQQEYTRLHSGGAAGGYNQQNLTQQQRQMMYSQSFGNNSFGKPQQKTPVNPITITTTPTTTAATASKQYNNNDDSDDIIEIPSSSSTRVNQTSNAPKRQEE